MFGLLGLPIYAEHILFCSQVHTGNSLSRILLTFRFCTESDLLLTISAPTDLTIPCSPLGLRQSPSTSLSDIILALQTILPVSVNLVTSMLKNLPQLPISLRKKAKATEDPFYLKPTGSVYLHVLWLFFKLVRHAPFALVWSLCLE